MAKFLLLAVLLYLALMLCGAGALLTKAVYHAIRGTK